MRSARTLGLTEPLPDSPRPEAYTFSGGVAEYVFTYEDRDTATSPSCSRAN
jgi:hypothetical protein